MTVDEAAQILRKMYDASKPIRKQGSALYLFGIKYADELDGLSTSEIALRAGMPSNYSAEINNEIRLAEYVQLKMDFP